jgi:dsRNA-specific ribonuclease
VLKLSLRNWLEATPLRAVSYLNHASQSGALSLTLQTLNTPQGFKASGILVLPPREEGARPEGLHQTGVGNTKKLAEQMCATRLLLKMLRIEPSQAFEAALTTPSPTQSANPNANAKSRLMEICQSQKWQVPSFTGTHSGADHVRVFDCKASIVIKGQPFEGKASGHATKKAAEVAAAEALLRKLEDDGKFTEASPANQTSVNGNKNAISALQEWAHRKHVALPSYVLQPADGNQTGFHCTLTVTGFDEAFTGTAPSKQDAKLEAAQKALKAIAQP